VYFAPFSTPALYLALCISPALYLARCITPVLYPALYTKTAKKAAGVSCPFQHP
jgi:hypothetical protein